MAILRILFVVFFLLSVAYAQPERIISLSPNVTETLYYLGVGDKIIAVSNYCNWPEKVNHKIKVGGMLNPSFEVILALRPDLIIISQEGTPIEVYHKLIDLGLKVYVFKPKSLFDLTSEITRLAKYLGVDDKAKIINEKFNNELKIFKNVFSGQKALFIIWYEKNIVVAGNNSHIGEIMTLLGLNNIVTNSSAYVSINIEEIIKKNPEIIFIGSGHSGTIDKKILEKLKNTEAIKNGKIFLISDKIYRLSPRIIEGIREMMNGKNSYNSSWKP